MQVRSSFFRAAAAVSLIASLAAPSLALASSGGDASAHGRVGFGRAFAAEIRALVDRRNELHRDWKDARKEKRQERAPEATTPVVQPTPACMKPAVLKREDALAVSADVYATALKTSLAARRTALLAAWDLTDATARQTAISAAWSAFQNSRATALNTHKVARNAAWAQFGVDRKACGQTSSTYDETRASLELHI